MINTVVVGLGYWGPNLARNVQQSTVAELLGLCDADDDRLRGAATPYPGVTTYREYEAVIADAAVDAVILATPAATHFDMALRALRAGKHVLVEKPLAISVAECDGLKAAASEVRRTLMVGHTFLYNSAVQWLRDHISSGDLGDVYYAYTQRLNLGRIRRDVDVIWDLATHDISILLYILDAKPTAVTARGDAYVSGGGAEVGFLTLEFGDGRIAHVHVSWLDPRKVRRVTVVGSKKMVVYDDVDPDARIQVYDKGIDVVGAASTPSSLEGLGEHQMRLRSGDLLIPHIPFQEPLRVELDDFFGAINEGREPLSDVRNGTEVVRVLQAASMSLERGGSKVEMAEFEAQRAASRSS